jgi:two-component system chemotaxis sensor kinase CheA
VEGLSGATILGDGKVALILDVPGLLRLAAMTGVGA